MERKFCVNCRHHRPAGTSPHDARCSLSKKIDLVTGLEFFGFCEAERMPLGKCKTLAILYEPKDAAH